MSAPIAAIIGVSVAATLFLFWLIYVHPASDAAAVRYTFLPNLNALLNGLSAIALLIGFYFIRTHRIAAHRASMMTAFVFSSLFLVCYVANHALHGDTLYPVHNRVYYAAYLPILISHIRAGDCGAAHRADHVLPVAVAAVRGASQTGAVHVSPVAVCFGDGRGGARDAGGGAALEGRRARRVFDGGEIRNRKQGGSQ